LDYQINCSISYIEELVYSLNLFLFHLKISETQQLLLSSKKAHKNFSQSGNSKTISAGHISVTWLWLLCFLWSYDLQSRVCGWN